MNINDWMVENKIANNIIQARHIFKGLKLHELQSDEARIARVRLYRAWRPKTDKRNQLPTYQAFDLAIAGIDPADVVERQIEMEVMV
jgi:hypothetical protein